MIETRPIRVAMIAGEESGDQLGADLIRSLIEQSGRPVEIIGVGGDHLQALGLKSLFDNQEIALMGIAAVLKRLPQLLRHIRQTAEEIARSKPDCLITIDSPDFSLRVARKVRALDPTMPIIHYVSPTVWAWREGRAKTMRAYVDHVLCLLPFEPEALTRLGGPPGTYVGHRLASDPNIARAAQAQLEKTSDDTGEKKLLLLPGSRRSEVSRLLGVFRETLIKMEAAGHVLSLTLPTVPRLKSFVETAVADWPVKPRIILDQEEKWTAFSQADAALACSGTVGLELALARVPYASVYKLDIPTQIMVYYLYHAWSASLPNLIAGWPVVPEFYNRYVEPDYLARLLPRLWDQTPARANQREGFAQIADIMRTEKPSGAIAAEAVLKLLNKH